MSERVGHCSAKIWNVGLLFLGHRAHLFHALEESHACCSFIKAFLRGSKKKTVVANQSRLGFYNARHRKHIFITQTGCREQLPHIGWHVVSNLILDSVLVEIPQRFRKRIHEILFACRNQ